MSLLFHLPGANLWYLHIHLLQVYLHHSIFTHFSDHFICFHCVCLTSGLLLHYSWPQNFFLLLQPFAVFCFLFSLFSSIPFLLLALPHKMFSFSAVKTPFLFTFIPRVGPTPTSRSAISICPYHLYLCFYFCHITSFFNHLYFNPINFSLE